MNTSKSKCTLHYKNIPQGKKRKKNRENKNSWVRKRIKTKLMDPSIRVFKVGSIEFTERKPYEFFLFW